MRVKAQAKIPSVTYDCATRYYLYKAYLKKLYLSIQ